MYFSIAVVSVFMAAAAAAPAPNYPSTPSSALVARDDLPVPGISCQTTSGSPSTSAVTDVINELKGRGTLATCPNGNGGGSHCTTVVSHNGAGIAVCGGSNLGDPLWCSIVADWMTNVQNACLDNKLQKVGGMYHIGSSAYGGYRVEIVGT